MISIISLAAGVVLALSCFIIYYCCKENRYSYKQQVNEKQSSNQRLERDIMYVGSNQEFR